MTPTPPPGDLPVALHRVDALGQASERYFRRLYNNLLRRRDAGGEAQDSRALRRIIQAREEEIARLSGILAAIDEGVIMQDTEGRLVVANGRARELLGGIKAFWESELGTLFNQYRDVEPSEGDIVPLSQPVRVQVNNRIIGAQIAAISDNGRRLGTLIVLRDVTRDTISERMKDQFITAISHELRTPMTIIKGVADLVAEQSLTGKPDRKLLETLTRNVDILDRMIVELLDIAELSDEDFSIRQDAVDLEPLLWSVVEGLRPETNRAGVKISIMIRDQGRLALAGDEQKLRWAFGHVLQNSIRYTEPGGVIIVTVSRASDEALAVTILDTGVGISERDLPHIFDRFYRGEPRTPSGRLLDPRGLGQGLYIARRVFEAHGGYIRVQSRVGQGSLFTITLPASADRPETLPET
jgi:signal transduction histidine kinase